MKNHMYILSIAMSLALFLSCGKEDDGDGSGTGPVITIGNVEVSEGDVNQEINFVVQLSVASDQEVSVSYATADGQAKAQEDYKATSGNLTFAPNQVQQTIAVEILADTLREPDEWFLLELSNPVNAKLDPNADFGRATLKNDDTFLQVSDAGYSTPESYDGYTLIWQDEFSGSEINKDDWVYDLGDGCPQLCGWGNNELEVYTDKEKNSYISDGKLIIEAIQEGVTYTSARMKTKGRVEFKYGRVDVRAILPQGQGLWPAIWMLGSNIDQVSWPACGEIDIMELVGHEPDRVHGTVHWDGNGNHNQFGGSVSIGPAKFSEEFHVFSIIWDEEKISWLVDDIQYHVVDITPADLSEFHEEFFFLLNVAVGGNWPGSPDGSTVFPQRMIIDYIRAFQEQ